MPRILACAAVLAGAAPLLAQGAPAASPMPTPLEVAAEDTALTGGGPTVTVSGRALVGAGVLHDRALMIALDGGASAVWVFRRGAAGAEVRAGDSVEATGVLHRYRGTTEVVATHVRRLEAAPRAVVPRALARATGADVVALEGRLLRVRGRVGAQGTSEGGHWVRLHPAGADSVTVWVPATHQRDPGLATLREGDDLELTGIAAVYRDNPSDAPVAQLVPRGPGDVRVHGIPGRWRELAARGGLVVLGLALVGWGLVRAATRRQARQLRETEDRYQQLLALSPDAVLVHDQARVLFANPAAARLLGARDAAALAGRRLDEFFGAEERSALAVAAGVPQSPLADAAELPQPGRRLRTRVRAATGEPVDVEVATSPCRYSDRVAAVILARDIGPQLRYERELRELALLDELTGLHNRRGFLTFAEAELRRLRAAGRGAALLFADLDGLKRINDGHGHAAGDAALTAVAESLREVVGAQGLVARWSGDEFAALVPEPELPADMADAPSDATIAERYERRLQAALARRRSPHDEWLTSATVGAHRLPPDGGVTLAAALAAADAGLYRRRASARSIATV